MLAVVSSLLFLKSVEKRLKANKRTNNYCVRFLQSMSQYNTIKTKKVDKHSKPKNAKKIQAH